MTNSVRPGTLAPAAALVAWLFLDAVRVWLPSLLFVVGDAGSTSALTMGAIALAIVAVPLLLVTLLGSSVVRLGWPSGIALLVGGRLLLQITDGGLPQFAASSALIIGAGLAFGALGAGAPSGRQARIAVLLGIVGSIVVHAGLGTTDLIWRDGIATWTVVAVLLASLAVTARDARSELDPDASASGAAWPWWIMGPLILLLGVLTAPPGRLLTATAWPTPLAIGALIVAHGLAIAAAIGARWLGPAVAGSAGAGLVLFGTAGSLQAGSLLAVAAQFLLAVGAGLIVGSLARLDVQVPVRRRAVAAAGLPLGLVVVGFAYYAGYDLVLPFPRRAVLLAASALVAGAGLYTATVELRPALRERGIVRQLVAVVVATAVAAGAGATLVSSPTPSMPHASSPGEPIDVAVYNIHMGFDPRGRMSLARIGQTLDDRSPDIVVLNEVDRGWLTTGSREPLRILQEQLDMPYVFAPAADEIWGNAVLSRYPITEFSVERLPRGEDAMARSQLIVIMEVDPDRRVALIATHLSHVDNQGNTRLPQARAVAGTLARLQERGVPVLVAGDLNAGPDAAELATFGDLARSAVPPGTPTYPSGDPEVQIDHLLVTEEFDVANVEVPDVGASDHLPIFTRLLLAPPPES